MLEPRYRLRCMGAEREAEVGVMVSMVAVMGVEEIQWMRDGEGDERGQEDEDVV